MEGVYVVDQDVPWGAPLETDWPHGIATVMVTLLDHGSVIVAFLDP